jgi:hypothetical protein
MPTDALEYDGCVDEVEAVKLCLPEDRRIQLEKPSDLLAVARWLGKPILHGVIDRYPNPDCSTHAGAEVQILAVYDQAWVYYCELTVEKPKATLNS